MQVARGLYLPGTSAPCPATYLQRNQPPGVPPLELTGERTLPDVPEENYWYRRHLAVYRWIAERCAGLRVVDMACGEGYGSARARRARRRTWSGVDANPEAHEQPACGTRAPNLRFERALVERVRGRRAVGRDRLPADDRARRGARARCWSGSPSLLAPGGVAYISTPEPADARAAGRGAVRQSVARARVHGRGVPRAARAALLGGRAARRSSTRASCARTSWRCGSAGTASTRRCGLTRPFYDRFVPAISERDFALRDGDARRRARLPRRLPPMTACRAAERGELAIVLHSHMPYVEGFGTWPFGEEWLLEAIATSYLPLLRAARALGGARGARTSLTVGVTPVLADQLALPEVGRAVPRASCATCGASATGSTPRGSSAPASTPTPRTRCGARRSTTSARRTSFERARR